MTSHRAKPSTIARSTSHSGAAAGRDHDPAEEGERDHGQRDRPQEQVRRREHARQRLRRVVDPRHERRSGPQPLPAAAPATRSRRSPAADTDASTQAVTGRGTTDASRGARRSGGRDVADGPPCPLNLQTSGGQPRRVVGGPGVAGGRLEAQGSARGHLSLTCHRPHRRYAARNDQRRRPMTKLSMHERFRSTRRPRRRRSPPASSPPRRRPTSSPRPTSATANADGAVADYIPVSRARRRTVRHLRGRRPGRSFEIGDVDTRSRSRASPSRSSSRWCAGGRVRRARAPLGVNSTGLPFNSVMAVELNADRTMNPMVNAGAIATTSLMPGDTRGREVGADPGRAVPLRRPRAHVTRRSTSRRRPPTCATRASPTCSRATAGSTSTPTRPPTSTPGSARCG